MTKDQEIALIEKTIEAFGPASYFGPWLKDNRDQILSEIRSDLPIDIPTPGQAIAQARATINAAIYDAAQMRAQAHKDADEIRAGARRALERAAREL